MVCDIHVVAQVNARGRWRQTMEPPSRDRDYKTFAIYAGVKNYEDVQPISVPRGWPEDFIEPYDWYPDHDFSWLGGDEIISRWGQMGDTERAEAPLMDEHVAMIRELCKFTNYTPNDVRLVFGFDS